MVLFYGDEYFNATPQVKYRFRTVEAETNKQIASAGGLENWYASGQGRLM